MMSDNKNDVSPNVPLAIDKRTCLAEEYYYAKVDVSYVSHR